MFVKTIGRTLAKHWRYGAVGFGVVGGGLALTFDPGRLRSGEAWIKTSLGRVISLRTNVLAKCAGERRRGHDEERFREAIAEAKKCAELIQVLNRWISYRG